MCRKFWFGSLKEGEHSEDLDAEGRIILKRALKIRACGCELDSCDLGQGPVTGSSEHSNSPWSNCVIS
jgi:hypothetical protein